MNKFLVAFLCGVLAVNSSFAVVKCPDECVTWDKNDPTLVTVCFENAKPELTKQCKEFFTKFINDLITEGKDGYRVDLKYTGTVDVVGRADSTGKQQSNLTLSKNRAIIYFDIM